MGLARSGQRHHVSQTLAIRLRQGMQTAPSDRMRIAAGAGLVLVSLATAAGHWIETRLALGLDSALGADLHASTSAEAPLAYGIASVSIALAAGIAGPAAFRLLERRRRRS
jgi:hypothetical protein